METAQGEELYEAHDGEQMSFEQAVARCPFLKSFGETALVEIREELEAYKITNESTELNQPEVKNTETQPADIKNAEPKPQIKNDEAVESQNKMFQPEAVAEHGQEKAEENSSEVIDAADEVIQAVLAREHPSEETEKLESKEMPKERSRPGDTTKPKKPSNKPLAKLPDHENLALERQSETVKEETLIIEIQTVIGVPEMELQEPDFYVPEALTVEGLYSLIHEEARAERRLPEITEETLMEVEAEIFGEQAEEPEFMAEIEADVIVAFENLEPEQMEAVTRIAVGAYVITEDIAEILNEMNSSEIEPIAPEVEEEPWTENVDLNEILEIHIKELEDVCERLLEQLEIPAEPKNVRLLMRLLLQPELKQQIETRIANYEKGTIEAKTRDTAADHSNLLDFSKIREKTRRFLGKWASAHISKAMAT